MATDNSKLSRRIFLKVSGSAALTPVAVDAAQAQARAEAPAHAGHAAPPASGVAPGADNYLFFNAQEAAFIEAAVTRLIPPDALGPSALEAGVPHYLDLQLHGAWGAGERLYRAGPWAPGSPTQGYQLPFTPAELFRTALRGIRADLDKAGWQPFEQLPGDQQDRYLTTLQTSQRDLAGVPSHIFFESLLAMTIEGYFSDPVYGGNRGMGAWAMIGFPGAYAAYYEHVDQYGARFAGAPRSLAERQGHIHVMPGIPATAPASTAPARPANTRGAGPRGQS